MRKQTKLVAVLSAAALLAMGASMTSFAAGWVKDEANVWHYEDSDGNYVTDEWRKDGGRWFYLNEDGDMLTNDWVDNYYVGEDGHRLKNEWVKTLGADDDEDDPEVDEAWFYFDSKGLKVEGKSKKIGTKSYIFDDNGKMQTGWTEYNGNVYYCGGEDDGARTQSKWLWLECTDIDNVHAYDCADCDEEGWYWFEASGKMNVNKTRKVNGKWYFFNEHGQMLYEWINGEAASPSLVLDDEAASTAVIGEMIYANDVEDGSRGSGWQLIAGSYGTKAADDVKWYYFKDGKAKAATDTTFKIEKISWKADGVSKSGKFCFNQKGEMQTGLRIVNNKTYYFDGDGYMKTGKITADDENDDTFSFYFETKNTNQGQGLNKVKDKIVYVDGQKITAEDKYAVVYAHDKYYLVNKNGKIQSNEKTTYEIDNGGYVKVKDGVVVKYDANAKDGAFEDDIATIAYTTGVNVTTVNAKAKAGCKGAIIKK